MRLSRAPARAIVGAIVVLVTAAAFIVALALLAHAHAELWTIVTAASGAWFAAVWALLMSPPRNGDRALADEARAALRSMPPAEELKNGDGRGEN